MTTEHRSTSLTAPGDVDAVGGLVDVILGALEPGGPAPLPVAPPQRDVDGIVAGCLQQLVDRRREWPAAS